MTAHENNRFRLRTGIQSGEARATTRQAQNVVGCARQARSPSIDHAARTAEPAIRAIIKSGATGAVVTERLAPRRTPAVISVPIVPIPGSKNEGGRQ
jgi:hypothetical protein